MSEQYQLTYADHGDFQSLTNIVDAGGKPIAIVETGLGRNHNEGVARRLVSYMNHADEIRATLAAVDHTLSVHGHIDRETELHQRVVAVLAALSRS